MKRKVYRLDTSDNTHRDFDVNKAWYIQYTYIYERDLLQFCELFVVHKQRTEEKVSIQILIQNTRMPIHCGNVKGKVKNQS